MNRLEVYRIIRKGWNHLLQVARQWPFPGAPDLSLYDVLSLVIKEMVRDGLNLRAASMSFSLFVSLFPALLVVFTIIPFLPIPQLEHTLLEIIRQTIPEQVYLLIDDTVRDIVSNRRVGLLSVSLFLAVYFASNGVLSMMYAFDKMQPGFRQRSFWQKQLVALQILALLFFLLVASLVLIIGGQWAIRLLLDWSHWQRDDLYIWLMILRFAVLISAFYTSVGLIYYFAPATKKPFRFFSPGTLVGTLLLLGLSFLFSELISRFVNYNQLYGSIGTVLMTQLWIYYNSISLLIGFEIHAAILINRSLATSTSSDTSAD